MDRKPIIGDTVHYQSYGTPNGEYLPEPRAAIVTSTTKADEGLLSVCILNPTGLFFHENLPFAEKPTPGHWNWPQTNTTTKED